MGICRRGRGTGRRRSERRSMGRRRRRSKRVRRDQGEACDISNNSVNSQSDANQTLEVQAMESARMPSALLD